MRAYSAEYITQCPVDESIGNYAYGILTAFEDGGVDERAVNYTLRPRGVFRTIKPRSIDRVARTVAERIIIAEGGSLL